MSRIVARIALSLLLLQLSPAYPAERDSRIVSETIEWTWEVTPDHLQPDLPNVLLVGDSITRNYFPDVTKDLAGRANVYLFASSACAGDARLPVQLNEFFLMEHTRFRVIQFNNGMHGWKFSESEYQAGLPRLVAALRKGAPGARLIWANTTPVRKPDPGCATNARIQKRNEIAAAIMKREHIPIDDQYAVMEEHPDSYRDNVHPSEAASALEGQQAAQMIAALL